MRAFVCEGGLLLLLLLMMNLKPRLLPKSHTYAHYRSVSLKHSTVVVATNTSSSNSSSNSAVTSKFEGVFLLLFSRILNGNRAQLVARAFVYSRVCSSLVVGCSLTCVLAECIVNVRASGVGY